MTADKNLDFTLTEEMAILFVRDNELDLDDLDEKGRSYRVINLEGFNNMTDGAAKVLSEFDGQLNLQNLSNLSDSAAEHLSNYQGESLCLDSLVELSDAAADSLSKCKAEKIFLRALIEITDTAANSFSKYAGDLNINSPDNKDWVVQNDNQYVKLSNAAIESLSKKNSGRISWENPSDWADLVRNYDIIDEEVAEKFLKNPKKIRIHNATEISNEAAKILSNYVLKEDDQYGMPGEESLNLGLTSLSDEAAKYLANFQGFLGLNHLTQISDAAAEHLTRIKGGLEMNRVTDISDNALKSLSKIKSKLSLESVTVMSDAAAECFSHFRGEILHLGLTELSNAAAESLSRCVIDQLYLLRLSEISDAAAESFSKSKDINWLHLSGVINPSRTVRKFLSKFKGQTQEGINRSICFTNSRDWCGYCKDTHKPAFHMRYHDDFIRWSEYKKDDEWYKKILSST